MELTFHCIVPECPATFDVLALDAKTITPNAQLQIGVGMEKEEKVKFGQTFNPWCRIHHEYLKEMHYKSVYQICSSRVQGLLIS